MKNEIKNAIRQETENFVKEYQKSLETPIWRKPLIGFARADHPYIRSLKKIIGPSHLLPGDVLPGASMVIACFVPFRKELAATNRPDEEYASAEWAEAYEVTNAMLRELNQHLIRFLEGRGYRGAVSAEAFTFDRQALKSNWSHRHFAYAAGLGTFGMNNMLLTRAGGCGRYTTVVTDLDADPDPICEEEFCLYKKNGSCGVCMRHCPAKALSPQGYDRQKCYGILRKNAARYTEFGNSYEDGKGQAGSEVCGKCVVYAPCTFWEESVKEDSDSRNGAKI
jgi:epoxyqueuosine reductase QueG